jgi:hypothetical protein
MSIDESKSENEKSERPTEGRAEVVDETASTLVDSIFDIALAWAEFGVGQGKRALETSASTLEKLAQSLSVVQGKLRRPAS